MSTVWIVNPYGTLPGESWSTYRSTMLAECLARHGYAATQFISNFEHRSKTFRSGTRVHVSDRYTIEIVPSTRYDAHISIERVHYERAFARNLLARTAGSGPPDVVILAEPALFYYDILVRELLRDGRTALVLDVIDLWPELFELALPVVLRPMSDLVLSPLYFWRRRLYRRADAVVAVARDYLDTVRRLFASPDVPQEVVYWAFDDHSASSDQAPLSDAARLVHELAARKRPSDVWAVYAGTLGENYDIRAIVDLSRRLPAALRGTATLKVVVAGDGPLANLCRASASEDFVFVGRLAAGELGDLYRHADIALSTYRGASTVAMPIKAFDYLRFGLPMVNSLGRDLGALVREHDVGINYDPEDPAALSNAVERLTLDGVLREQMGRNAARLAPAFSAERQYVKFVDVLEAVAQRRARTQ
jgi:glycosyltransferase involved in cell wall biosynthesis